MSAQQYKVAGLLFIVALLMFLLCTTIAVWCINREHNRSAIFWMVLSGASAALMYHFSTYLN
jgi:hypothetical protein